MPVVVHVFLDLGLTPFLLACCVLQAGSSSTVRRGRCCGTSGSTTHFHCSPSQQSVSERQRYFSEACCGSSTRVARDARGARRQEQSVGRLAWGLYRRRRVCCPAAFRFMHPQPSQHIESPRTLAGGPSTHEIWRASTDGTGGTPKASCPSSRMHARCARRAAAPVPPARFARHRMPPPRVVSPRACPSAFSSTWYWHSGGLSMDLDLLDSALHCNPIQ